jgi:hypothetical protein
MMDDTEAGEPTYAEDRDRATDRGVVAFPHIIALLTANGHSLNRAVEIVQVAQRSWSKDSV